MLVLVEASKVPPPLNGLAAARDNVGVLEPWVQLPVKVKVVVTVTVPELLLVTV